MIMEASASRMVLLLIHGDIFGYSRGYHSRFLRVNS